jgi:acetoin utilization protein AcuB
MALDVQIPIDMRVQDVMSTEIKTVGSGTTIGEARSLMRAQGIHHVLVRDERRIVGVVSDRDLGGRVGARNGSGEARPVAEVMTTNVVTALPTMTIRQAANLLRGRAIGCLPVLDGDRPVGIVTTTDLLELIGRGAQRPIERSTRWTLRDRGVRRAGPTARHARRG